MLKNIPIQLKLPAIILVILLLFSIFSNLIAAPSWLIVVVDTIALISLGSFIYGLFNYVHKPLSDLKEELNRAYDDEVSALEYFVNSYKSAQENVRKASKFATQVGDGKLDESYPDLNKEDMLGNSLENMRLNLVKVNQREEKRNWITGGLAHFSEVLRDNDKEFEEYCFSILKNLINYLGCNQGGFYISHLNEENKEVLSLKAAYAYEKRKFLEKGIEPGEGLVGQAFLEKKTIYLTNIPDGYINIISGLGEAEPRCVYIFPLVFNEKVHGVVEIASFDLLEDHHKEFIKMVSESIASSISFVKSNEHTQKLLSESRELATQLQSQEEEMRQNMEELQATQEEMKRNQVELDEIFNSINSTLATMEINMDGEVLSANDKLLSIMGYKLEEVMGKSHEIFIEKTQDQKEEMKDFWSNIKNGKPVSKDIYRINKSGEGVWLDATYNPIRNTEGDVYKVLLLSKDITKEKEEQLEFKRLSMVANHTNNSVVITDKDGFTEYVNNGFEKLTGYSYDEIIGRKPGSLLQGKDTDPETVERISKKIQSEKPFSDEILNYTKSGEPYWISIAINPVFGEDGKVEKFISIQAEISDTKRQEIELSCHLQAINKTISAVEFDMDGKIRDANDIFLSLTGYDRKDLIGKPESILLTEDQKGRPQHDLMWSNLKEGKFFAGEYKILDKNGKEQYLQSTYNPIFNANGEPYKITMFAQFTTEQRERQNELQSVANALKNTLPTLELHMDGKFKSANTLFFSEFGYKRLELRNKMLSDLLAEGYDERLYETIIKSFESSEENMEVELAMKSADDKKVTYHASFFPIKDLEGNITKIICLLMLSDSSKKIIQENGNGTHKLKAE